MKEQDPGTDIIHMRYIYFALLIFIMASCCKALCVDEPEVWVSFNKLKRHETDTIHILRYQAGTTNQTDSTAVFFPFNAADSNVMSIATSRLPAGDDWKIILPQINKEFHFTQIQTKEENCQCEGGKYTIVTGFRMNGQQYDNQLIAIE